MTAIADLRRQLTAMVDGTDESGAGGAFLYRWLVIAAALSATLMAVLESAFAGDDGYALWMTPLRTFAFGLLAADYLLRLFAAGPQAWRYARSLAGGVDLAAALPVVMEILGTASADLRLVCGVAAFLKLARWSPALPVLREVLIAERRPLLSSLYVMLLLTLVTSTLLYFVEREANPEGFRSVPHALWWAIVTLATLGYGDVIPQTVPGRILGSVAAILGFGMFALPAGILANGFAQEIRRHHQAAARALVAKLPLFAPLDAPAVARIAELVRVRRFARGETILRQGERGDAMYFLLDGEVEVRRDDWRARLGAGDFFGEIALLKEVPRTATVVARRRCEALELASHDFRRFLAETPEVAARLEAVAAGRAEPPAAARDQG